MISLMDYSYFFFTLILQFHYCVSFACPNCALQYLRQITAKRRVINDISERAIFQQLIVCNMQPLLEFKFTFCLEESLEREYLALILHLFRTFITITTQNQYSFRKYNLKMEPGAQAPAFLLWIQRRPRTKEKWTSVSQAKCYLF